MCVCAPGGSFASLIDDISCLGLRQVRCNDSSNVVQAIAKYTRLSITTARGSLMSMGLGRGGFRLRPTRVEFWEGQPSRLHDRFVYSLTSEAGGEEGEAWTVTRLQP